MLVLTPNPKFLKKNQPTLKSMSVEDYEKTRQVPTEMEGRPMEKMDNRVPKGPKRASQSQPLNERSYLERRRRNAYQGKGG